jgi:hypothetical protein
LRMAYPLGGFFRKMFLAFYIPFWLLGAEAPIV